MKEENKEDLAVDESRKKTLIIKNLCRAIALFFDSLANDLKQDKKIIDVENCADINKSGKSH